MSRSKTVLCCALAACKFLWSPEYGAAAPLNLPVATGLSPGDILISDFFNGWIKFDPTSNQLYALNWPKHSPSIEGLSVDLDGSILSKRFGEPLVRVNHRTGALTPLVGTPTHVLNYRVLPDGDFLMYQGASSSNRGDVWSGGEDSIFLRYDRETGTTSPLPKPHHFSPQFIATGANGEIFIDEFFRGIQQIDLATGTMSNYAQPPASPMRSNLIGVFPNGDLAIATRIDGPSRFDLASGTITPVSSESPFPTPRWSIDEDGNFWAIDHRESILFLDSATGEISERLPRTSFFSPMSWVILPSDWTPPPVPEPSALVLALAAGGAGIATRRPRRQSRMTATIA